MKNTFDTLYQQHKELKARFQTAKAANDAEAMDQVRAERNALMESIEAKGAAFARIFDLYESAMDRGNDCIDICECYDYRDEAALIACFRDYGIDTFTFSSGWSSAVETAWIFKENGCQLEDLIQINGDRRSFGEEGYEKAPAYLFRIG